MKYAARSASDKTDEWPFWMVVDTSSNINVTHHLLSKTGFECSRFHGGSFASRSDAETLADLANANLKD